MKSPITYFSDTDLHSVIVKNYSLSVEEEEKIIYISHIFLHHVTIYQNIFTLEKHELQNQKNIYKQNVKLSYFYAEIRVILKIIHNFV